MRLRAISTVVGGGVSCEGVSVSVWLGGGVDCVVENVVEEMRWDVASSRVYTQSGVRQIL